MNRDTSLENMVKDKHIEKEKKREHIRWGVGILSNANDGGSL